MDPGENDQTSERLPRRAAVAAAVIGFAAAAMIAVPTFLTSDGGSSTAADGAPRATPEEAGESRPAPGAKPAELLAGSGYVIAKVRAGKAAPLYAKPGGRRIGRAAARTEFGSPQVLSVLDSKGAWLEVTLAGVEGNRTSWVRADPKALAYSTTKRALHIDLSDRTLELRQAGERLRKLTVTIGGPGTETPTGRFAITDTFVGGLNPVYGCCALAISATQEDLPASWPGGERIAIHATTGEVGLAESYGCVRATNADARALTRKVPLGAPVFIEG